MRNLLLTLLLVTPSLGLARRNDGWCDAGKKTWVLACSSPYWVTTGQYYINHGMNKSVNEIINNGFIDCWKVEDRARIVRKHHFNNFRIAQRRWTVYEVNHKGWHGYIVSNVCK